MFPEEMLLGSDPDTAKADTAGGGFSFDKVAGEDVQGRARRGGGAKHRQSRHRPERGRAGGDVHALCRGRNRRLALARNARRHHQPPARHRRAARRTAALQVSLGRAAGFGAACRHDALRAAAVSPRHLRPSAGAAADDRLHRPRHERRRSDHRRHRPHRRAGHGLSGRRSFLPCPPSAAR